MWLVSGTGRDTIYASADLSFGRVGDLFSVDELEPEWDPSDVFMATQELGEATLLMLQEKLELNLPAINVDTESPVLRSSDGRKRLSFNSDDEEERPSMQYLSALIPVVYPDPSDSSRYALSFSSANDVFPNIEMCMKIVCAPRSRNARHTIRMDGGNE